MQRIATKFCDHALAPNFNLGATPGCFFDVRVFHPNAPSYRGQSLYRRHEREKKREYGDRVREIEHASFIPLIFSLAIDTPHLIKPD